MCGKEGEWGNNQIVRFFSLYMYNVDWVSSFLELPFIQVLIHKELNHTLDF